MVSATNTQQDKAVRLLSDLIAIESVNPIFDARSEAEAAVANFVEDYCRRLGLDVSRQSVLPGRENVLIELRVPGAKQTLLLESHMDTVALEPMGDKALKPDVLDGRLYGRGACDDKGSLAAMMLAMEILVQRRRELRVNVMLLAAVDEEYKFRGVLAFIDKKIPVQGAVVGEPTSLRVVVAHTGVVRWRLSTIGRSTHGSCPEKGENAILQMAQVLQALDKLQPLLKARVHPLVGSPTFNVGRIWGGIGVNFVPDRCTIEVERRLIPGEEHAAVLEEVKDLLKDLCADNPGIKLEHEEPFVTTPTLSTPPDSSIVEAARDACRTMEVDDSLAGVRYGSDASKLWTFGGVPTVVLGPGAIAQAHSGEEYVPIGELVTAAQLYVGTALSFSG